MINIIKVKLLKNANLNGYDYTCSASPDNRKVMADFKGTPDALWCEGKNYKEA